MFVHAIERARERYGLSLTNADLTEIATLATPNTVVQKCQDGSTINALAWRGQSLIAVVKKDILTKRIFIATFLPPNAFSLERRTSELKKCIGKAGRRSGFVRKSMLAKRQRRRESYA